MQLEFDRYLRAHHDLPNHAGRSLSEHTLHVTEVAGVLTLRIRPVGFNNQEQVYTVDTAGRLVSATEETLAGLRVAEAAAAEAAMRDRDLGIQAADEMERKRVAMVEVQRAERAAAEARARAPVNIAAALPDGDPSP